MRTMSAARRKQQEWLLPGHSPTAYGASVIAVLRRERKSQKTSQAPEEGGKSRHRSTPRFFRLRGGFNLVREKISPSVPQHVHTPMAKKKLVDDLTIRGAKACWRLCFASRRASSGWRGAPARGRSFRNHVWEQYGYYWIMNAHTTCATLYLSASYGYTAPCKAAVKTMKKNFSRTLPGSVTFTGTGTLWY